MLKTIKQLWPFWIYFGIISGIFASSYINEDLKYAVYLLAYVPILLIYPFIFGPFLAIKINKRYSISIKKSILMSFIILIFIILSLNIMELRFYIYYNLNTFEKFLDFFIGRPGKFERSCLFPALVTALTFQITSLILIYKKKKRDK